MIGVLFSGSLLRDQERQLKGGGVGRRGGAECPTGTVVSLPRTHAHDSQVSGDTRSKMLVRGRYGSIHALPARGRTKTLWRARGAAEFDSRLARSAVRGRLCSGSLRRFTVAEPRPSPPFPAYGEEGDRGGAVVVRARTPQWLGWLTKKWPHVWRDRRGRSAVWSSGEAQAPPAWIGRTAKARESSARPDQSRGRAVASVRGVRK